MRLVPADRKSKPESEAVIKPQGAKDGRVFVSSCLLPHGKSFKVVAVSVGLVPTNLQHFRNESNSGSPFDLDQQVQRISDVALDGAIGEFDVALQDTARESAECLLGGVGMNG